MVSPLVPSVWITPRPEDLGLIAGFLAFALMGQAAMFSAFHFGEASLLSPFHFVQIVGATQFGYWFFGDFPEPARLSGIAIIIASGIYIAVREAGNSRGAQ
jgi:drug/metabolite transporter (DMT)-like permease